MTIIHCADSWDPMLADDLMRRAEMEYPDRDDEDFWGVWYEAADKIGINIDRY